MTNPAIAAHGLRADPGWFPLRSHGGDLTVHHA